MVFSQETTVWQYSSAGKYSLGGIKCETGNKVLEPSRQQKLAPWNFSGRPRKQNLKGGQVL